MSDETHSPDGDFDMSEFEKARAEFVSAMGDNNIGFAELLQMTLEMLSEEEEE